MATTAKTTKSAALKKDTGKASTALAVKKNYNVADIQAQLKAQAAAMGDRTAPPGGNKIKVTQSKEFVLPNGQKTAGPIVACVVDFCTVHNFYEGKYDPKNIQPPVCYAIGSNPKDMTPSAKGIKIQAKTCQECPMNQFGSEGDGKACKNGRRLALLPANDAGNDVDHEADMWVLDVSPTALKKWDAYVQTLARTFQLPPVGFLTTISFDPGVDYPQLMFTEPTPITSLGEAMARQDEAKEILATEPDLSGYDPKGGKTTGKAGARR